MVCHSRTLSLSLSFSVPADLHKKSPNQLGRWAAEQLLGSNHLVADLPTALEYPGPGPVGVNGGYTLYDASARRLTHCSQLVGVYVSVNSVVIMELFEFIRISLPEWRPIVFRWL